ncbi:MAG: hypothetical protein ABIT71_01380 [Vicinamibacteraceae bacterium]
MSEYRIPLTVDGKPTGKPEQAAMKLFGRLARARSTAEELEVLKEQNVSHGLGAVVWGMTLYPLGVIRADLRDRFLGGHPKPAINRHPKTGHFLTPSAETLTATRSCVFLSRYGERLGPEQAAASPRPGPSGLVASAD